VSIELPKYSIQTEEKKPNRFKNFLLPSIVIGSLLIGYFGGGFYLKQRNESLSVRNDVLENINNDNQDLITQLTSEVSILKTEQKVKQQAMLLIQKDYKDSIEKQTELKSEITFYEKLLSPNVKNKGLRVFNAVIQKRDDNYFDLKIILVQKLERAKEIAGTFKISLVGREKSIPKTLDLSVKMDTKYKFRYFHNISLNFSLPEGFQPEQLVVNLFPQNKKAKTVEYTVEWQDITQ
jgi:hypothetical protein